MVKFITKGGRKFKVPEKAQATTNQIAQPQKAQAAIKKSSDRGAFDISKAKTPVVSNPKTVPTVEQSAKGIVKEEFTKSQQGKIDLAKKFNLDIGDQPTTIGELFSNQRKNQDKQKTRVEDELRRQEEIEQISFNQARREKSAGVAATKAELAQGREGIFSQTTPDIVNEFSTVVSENLARVRTQVESASARRDQIREDLEKAQQQGNIDALQNLQESLGAAETRVREAETEQIKARSEAAKQKIQITSSALDVIDTIGAGIEKLDIAQIESLIAGTNLTLPMVQAIKQGKIMEADIAKTKDEIERGIKTGQLEKINADIARIKAETIKIEAENTPKTVSTANFVLANSRTVSGGASNGAGRIDPTQIIGGYSFGNGQAGDNVTDATGNVVARITSPFGADHSQISGEKEHNGLDVVFKDGKATALQGGRVVKKGFSGNTYGGYAWIETPNGQVMQYGHLNFDDLKGLSVGQSLNPSEFIARQETNPSRWGSSSGAHTDIRFVGNADDTVDPVVESYATGLLDGTMKLANITGGDKEETAKLRSETQQRANQLRNEGYKSAYPVLTESQQKLADKISDDYNGDKRISDMLDVESGFNTVKTLFSSDQKILDATGFDDVAAINAFQRMIDPGATVREGDVTLLEATIPFLTRISPSFRWSQFQKGDKLPAEIRQSLLRVAKEVYNTKAVQTNGSSVQKLKNRSKAAGVDFSFVGNDFTIYGDEGDSALNDADFLLSQGDFEDDDLTEAESIFN